MPNHGKVDINNELNDDIDDDDDDDDDRNYDHDDKHLNYRPYFARRRCGYDR